MPYTNIDKPSKYFNTVLYNGNGSTQSITGVGFQPDFIWIKGRSGATDHALYDAVRGVQKDLVSNSTAAETTQTTGLTAFGSDGFTVGALAKLNTSTATYVAWNWLASNTSGSSNTSGTITSTVAVNTTAGFSIVSYTGTGATATVGHGLGVTPKMIIVKQRSSSSLNKNWCVYHSSLGATATLILNGTNASSSGSDSWNNTSPTSSVFSLGAGDDAFGTQTNVNTKTYIAYCFAEVKGFSKFGSYTGNGNADGTFVYTGFKPAMVILKITSTTGGWIIYDNKRDSSNVVDLSLSPSGSNAEDFTTNDEVDFLSNGFKMRNTGAIVNASSATFIYMAFAENPFVSSRGIPCTAR